MQKQYRTGTCLTYKQLIKGYFYKLDFIIADTEIYTSIKMKKNATHAAITVNKQTNNFLAVNLSENIFLKNFSLCQVADFP